jgi:hypothetical protein
MSIADKMQNISLLQANSDGWRLLKQAHNYFLFCFGGGATNKCGNGPAALFMSNTLLNPGANQCQFRVIRVGKVETITRQ